MSIPRKLCLFMISIFAQPIFGGDLSGDNRVPLHIQFNGGVSSTVGETTFGSAGFYLTPHWVLEMTAGRGDLIILDAQSYGIRSKNFWGNSFYTNLGVKYREIKMYDLFVAPAISSLTGKDYESTLTFTDVGPEFAIGNQWQWDTFQLGCDWLGIYHPALRSSIHYETSYDGKTTQSSIPTKGKDAEGKDYDISAKVWPVFLRLYAGVAF